MIFINNIPSTSDPDKGGTRLFDDRKEKIQLINGTAIQDGGIFFGGFQLSCTFTRANFELIKALWLAKQKVSYTDQVGDVYTGLTMKFGKLNYVDKFNNYVKLDFELWKEE